MDNWQIFDRIIHHPLVIGIILAIFSALLATFFRLKWGSDDKQIAKKAFKSIWISSKKLAYKDLSGRKEYSEKYPSTQNNLTNKVQEILNRSDSKNVLVISEAMAGKTYFTVNYLKKLEKTYVLIPNYDRFDEFFEFIPKAPKNSKHKIILLDDIHTCIKTITRLASFIEQAIDEGYIIWANTISGSDFEIVRNNIPIKILSSFHDVSIPSSLNKDEALKIAQSEGIEKLPIYFDGNIGSIFYDITQVKERYNCLDGIGKLLLLVMKQLYLVGIYYPPTQILKSNLRKLLESYEPNISSETVNKKIDVLEKNGFLLKNKDPKSISFEEKYLRIVVEPDLRVKDFMKSISEIFPKNVATYTQAMQSATSYVEAEKIYKEMRNDNIHPHDRPFSVLIGKANDSDVGLTWLKEMDKLGIPPDDFIINALLRTAHGDIDKKERVVAELELRNIKVREKIINLLDASKINLDLYGYNNLMNLSGSYEKALEIFDGMKQNGISPDTFTYNILIQLSADINKGLELFDEMIASNISPDVYTYGILISLSPNYCEGKKLHDKMKKEGIIPNATTYGTLMMLAKSYENAVDVFHEIKQNKISLVASNYNVLIQLSADINKGLELFDEMIASNISPDVYTYGILISLSPNYCEGKKLHDKMKKEGIIPNATTYGTLMMLAKSYENAVDVFHEMKLNKIIPDRVIYNTLIKLSNDLKTGMKLRQEMVASNILPDIFTFNILISVSKDYTKGRELLDEMRQLGCFPDIITYDTLINLSNDFDLAKGLLLELNNLKLTPTVITYNSIIKLSKNFDNGFKLLKEMKQNKISPDVFTYNILIYLSKNIEKGLELLREMINQKIDPDHATYGTLIGMSRDFQQSMNLFDEMIERRINPNIKTFGTLMKLTHDFEKAKELFDEMKKKKILPNVEIYGTLMSLTHNFHQRKKLYDEMIEKGIKPNEKIYTMLIKASNNIETGRLYLQRMLANGIKPNTAIYNAIIWLYKHNYQEAIAIMQYEMPDKQLNPDCRTYTQLMNISRNFNIAIDLFEEMCRKKISPNDRTLGVLSALAGNDENNQSKLKKLWNENVLQ